MKDKPKNDWRNWLADMLGLNPTNRETLQEMLQSKGADFVSVSEMKMIQNVFNMREWRIRDVMVPFGEVDFVRAEATYRDAVALVCETQHSRYPVLDESGENFCGILLAKDLLKYVDKPQAFSVTNVMREAVFETDAKPLDKMLDDFRAKRIHMVVVNDEHAQTAGIITIEDVLERIVGEIEDESDKQEDMPVADMTDGRKRIRGSLSVEEFTRCSTPTCRWARTIWQAGWRRNSVIFRSRARSTPRTASILR